MHSTSKEDNRQKREEWFHTAPSPSCRCTDSAPRNGACHILPAQPCFGPPKLGPPCDLDFGLLVCMHALVSCRSLLESMRQPHRRCTGCAAVRSQRHRLRRVCHPRRAAAAPRSCYSTFHERYCGGNRAAGSCVTEHSMLKAAAPAEHSMLQGCASFLLGHASYRGLCPAMLVIALPASLRGMMRNSPTEHGARRLSRPSSGPRRVQVHPMCCDDSGAVPDAHVSYLAQ